MVTKIYSYFILTGAEAIRLLGGKESKQNGNKVLLENLMKQCCVDDWQPAELEWVNHSKLFAAAAIYRLNY